ncbi:MAG: hypothetical protein ABIJ34_01070 [archaeon]
MTMFAEVLTSLENLGLLDVLLPFILIFTIAFAVLQKSKILGPSSHRFNTMVSFVISLAAIIPHVIGRGPDVVIIINNALPNISLLMVACMMVLLLIGVFGNDINIAGTPLAGITVIFAIIAVGYVFLSSSGFLGDVPLVDPETRSLLIAILVFGLIVAFITAEPGEKKANEGIGQFLDGMGKVFGGGGQGHGGGHGNH